jgi:integrase
LARLCSEIDSKLHGQHRAIAKLQAIFGLRFSECASIKNSDFLANGLVTISGTKGGNKKWVYCTFLDEFRSLKSVDYDRLLFSISYFSYYRALRRAQLYFKKRKTSKYMTVTHAGRNHVLGLISTTPDTKLSEVMAFSGHKSLNGLSYYVPK